MRESDRERLTFEKSWSVNQKSAADFVIERVRYVLTETESRIQQQVINPLQGSSQSGFQQILKDFADKEDLVSHIFKVKGNGSIVFRYSRPPYPTIQEPEFISSQVPSSPMLIEAEDFEFKTNNYPAAIKAYQSLIRNTNSKILSAQFLNRIARCYKKAGNFDQAINSYKSLLKNYETEESEGGLPLGFVARYFIGNLFFEKGDLAAGIAEYLTLYSALLEGKWTISKDRFESYSFKIEERIPKEIEKLEDLGQTEDLRKKWDTLLLLKATQLRQLELMEVLEQDFVPDVLDKMSSSPVIPEEFFYYSESIDQVSYNAGFFSLPNGEVLGFLIDGSVLAAKTVGAVPAACSRAKSHCERHNSMRTE